MYRSFTNRILGGVCGGLADSLPLNAWQLRTIWAALAIFSGGLFAVLYVLLWWLLPQRSLVAPQKVGLLRRLLVFLLFFLTVIGWVGVGAGWWQTEGGRSWLWPAVLVVMAFVLTWRQLGRA